MNVKRDYFFTPGQIDAIREGALSILSEIGVKLGRGEWLDHLVKKGFKARGGYVLIEKPMALAKITSQKTSRKPRPRGMIPLV